MANVSFVRKDLAKLLPIYFLIRDVIEGELKIKSKGKEYLPMPNESDTSKENVNRYKAYLKRAVFYNVARRTICGLIGQIFARPPAIKIPDAMKSIQSNVTGTGIDIFQLSKMATEYVLAYSRAGLFIDYPDVSKEEGATVEKLQSGNIRPTFSIYEPWDIINWRTIEKGAEEILSLIVLKERYIFSDDGFEMKEAFQCRVLRLDESGYYMNEIYREPVPTECNDRNINTQRNFQYVKGFSPLDFNGQRIDIIPFRFIGALNNDHAPDEPFYYDICSLNIAHYRNSADYEESCFIVGQPTPVMTGLTQEWFKDVLNSNINFGSRGGIPLPVGGDAKLLQAEENSMIKEAMETKERQMVALGAKLIEQKQVQRTATEASIENLSETSILSSVAENVSSAFEWGLNYSAELLGLSETQIEFKLNNDFDAAKYTTEQRSALVKEWQSGAISFVEMRNGLRKAGVATEDDKAVQAEAQVEQERKASLESKKTGNF